MTALAYQFQAAGQDTVLRAFTNIARQAAVTATKVEKEAQKQQKAQEKAADKAANEARKAEERRFKEVERYGARIQKEIEKEAQARIRVEQRANEKIVADRQRLLSRLGSVPAGVLKGTIGAIGIGGLLSAAGLAASAVGGVGSAAREALALRGQANRISIMGHRAGGEFMAPEKIAGALERTALANPGVEASALGEGLQELVSHTGDLKGSIEQLDTLAVASQALGSDAKDTAKVMVALSRSFDIKDPQQLKDALASLAATTKQAGVPVEALESQVLSLAATASRFGYKGAAGVRETGGLLALATAGLGDPAKAEKASLRFLDRITENSAHLDAMGVRTRDKSGAMLPMQQIVSNLISGLGGHSMPAMKAELTKLLGGGARGGVATLGKAISTYEETFQATKGTDQEKQRAATEALNEQLTKLMGTSADYSNLQAEAGQVQQSASSQMTVAWERVVSAVNEDVVPALIPLVNKLPELAEAAVPAIDALGSLADGLQALMSALPEMGIGKENTKPQQRELEKNIKHIEDRIGESGAPSPKMLELRDKYKAELERLQGGGGSMQPGGMFEGIHSEFDKARVQAEPPDWFVTRKHKLGGSDTPSTDTSDHSKSDEGRIAASKAVESSSHKHAKANERAAEAAEKFALMLARANNEGSRNLPLSARP